MPFLLVGVFCFLPCEDICERLSSGTSAFWDLASFDLRELRDLCEGEDGMASAGCFSLTGTLRRLTPVLLLFTLEFAAGTFARTAGEALAASLVLL